MLAGPWRSRFGPSFHPQINKIEYLNRRGTSRVPISFELTMMSTQIRLQPESSVQQLSAYIA